MSKIYNFGFASLDTTHLSLLTKLSVLPQAEVVSHDSILPVMHKDIRPEEIRVILTELLDKFVFTDDDYVILSGAPDIMYYIVDYFLIKEDIPIPRFLVPVGTRGRGKFCLSGFRELVADPEYRTCTPLFIFDNSITKKRR